ncbi:hypothetical protein Sjap_019066 [Stephania japonica]|uniref:WRKY domain-containing protein n=1 Tax=Stephania japonica TaxID=461633 RepID=A0AAP0F0W2_9MAGN
MEEAIKKTKYRKVQRGDEEDDEVEEECQMANEEDDGGWRGWWMKKMMQQMCAGPTSGDLDMKRENDGGWREMIVVKRSREAWIVRVWEKRVMHHVTRDSKAMDSTWVDTSLGFDLNINPLKVKKEFDQSNFTDLALKLSTDEQQVGDLVEKINRVNEENKKLSEMLTVMCENYNVLQNRLMDLKRNNSPNNIKEASPISKKRKTDQSDEQSHNNISSSNGGDHHQRGNYEISSSEENANNNKKQIRIREDPNSKTSVMYVHSDPSDSRLIVKDGYLWRKYGQKVTRDNPSPRAYFKCSFAPSCPVKKKVQRSVKDQSVLVATYEGEHNHPRPNEADETSTMGSNRGAVQHGSSSVANCNSSSSPIRSSGSTITLDLTQNADALLKPPIPEVEIPSKNINNNKNVNSAVLQHFLVEQMASSLSKDPSFTAALAAAISGNFLQK